MCFGSDSETVTRTEIPDFLRKGVEQNLSSFDTLAKRSYPVPNFPRIAGFSPDTTKGFDLTRSNVGSYGPAYDKAIGTASTFADLDFPDIDIQRYMNPYMDQVLNRGADMLRREGDISRAQITRNMAASGGQDGGRHGVVEGRSYKDQGDALSNFIATQLMNSYGAATQQFNADRDARLTSAAALGNLGTAKSNMGLRDAAAMAGIGATQEGKDQENLDLAEDDFYGEFYYPLDMLQLRQSLLTGSPYSTTQRSTGGGGSTAAQGIGAGASVLGALGSMGGAGSSGGFDWSNLWPF